MNVSAKKRRHRASRTKSILTKGSGKEIKLKMNYLQEPWRKKSLTLKTKICSSTKSNSHLLQLDHVLSGQAIFVRICITVMAFANSSTLYLCLVKHPNDVDLCNSVYRVLVYFVPFLIETNEWKADGVEQYDFFLLVLLPMGFRPIAWKW